MSDPQIRSADKFSQEGINDCANEFDIKAGEDSRRETRAPLGDFLVPILEEQTAHHLEMTKSMGSKAVILIGSPGIGQGDHDLASRLMSSFFFNLTRLEILPRSIIFVNSGVFLTTQGSDILAYLITLQDRGVGIISCITCLDHYGLRDKLGVGRSANMFTITEELLECPRVISL